MAAMLLDLSFQDAEAEAEYRRARLAALLPAHARAIEWTRLLASLLFAARLALLRKSGGSIAAAALACLTTGIQLAVCGRAQLRLRYVAAVVCEVLMVVAGCALMPHLQWSSGPSTLARSWIELVTMGGHAWSLFSIVHSPLPFRLLFPVLAAQSAVLVLHAPRMCASPGMQHAYAALHAGLARRARLLPAAAAAAAAAPRGAASLCAAVYQPAFIILSNTLAGYLCFSAELSQRRAFLRRRRGGAGQPALLAALRERGRLPVRPADFWLQFSLPAACSLFYLHLSMRA